MKKAALGKNKLPQSV
jgi:hypothetical protein